MNPTLANTLTFLEKAACAALRVWTGDMYFLSPFDDGATPVLCSVYEGHVPMVQAADNQSIPKAPSIAVRATNAEWNREFGEATLTFAILTWNPDLSRMGYRDVENLAWRINQGIWESVGIPQVAANQDGSYSMSDGNLFQLSYTKEATHFELIDDPSLDFFPFFLGIFSAHFGLPTPLPQTAPWGKLSGQGVFSVTTPTAPVTAPHRSKSGAAGR